MGASPPKAVVVSFTRTHNFLHRITGGRIGRKIIGMPVLLITTVGRKSGKLYTTPVVYQKDSGDYIVIASFGGSDKHPDWYYNITANPQVKLEVNDKKLTAYAVITEGRERTRLFNIFKTASDNFVRYEKSAQRIIPVIRLKPVDERIPS